MTPPTGFPTAAPRPLLGRLSPARLGALRAECAELAGLDDAEFGVRLLAGTPTHEERDPALLRRWAEASAAYGRELAGSRTETGVRVVVREGGLDRLLLARYVSRPAPVVEVFGDTLALGEELVEELGWRAWFPEGALRAAAVAHEEAHGRLHADAALRRELRRRTGHTALRVGRFRVAGHVAGAVELVAHGYAKARCGLGRTPLLLTAALASAARTLGTPPWES